jgi:hypothetical protein
MGLVAARRGIARDVCNATVAEWDEAHIFGCLSWLYDGANVPTQLPNQNANADG